MPQLRRQRSSLLTRFGVVSFVLLALLGVVLDARLRTAIRQRTLDDAIETAAVAARTGVYTVFPPGELTNGFVPLAADRVAALDAGLGPALTADGVARFKVWNQEHWIVYSDNPRLVGRWFVPDDGLTRALQGETSSTITSLRAAENLEERDFRTMVSVYLPVRAVIDAAGARYTDASTAPVIGAVEIYVPYEPIQAKIDAHVAQLRLLVAGGLVMIYLGLFRLVAAASRRLRRQAALNRHQARHDPLTDLPNRTEFLVKLDDAIARSGAVGRKAGVLLVDLDRFKEVNDTLGHHSGDRVLTTLAERLAGAFRDGDTVARLGGDEFALVISGIDGDARALAVADKLRALLAEPIELTDGLSLEVHGSIGIALAPDHGAAAEQLLQRADVAMYAAKRGHTGVEVYRDVLDHYSPERLQLAGEVRDAIERRELFLMYQPKLDLRTGEVTGAEALVRWAHPTRGMVSPGEFLPVVENTELAVPLTAYVLHEALAACRRWVDRGLDLQIAVNVPARCLADDRIVVEVAAAMDRHRLAARHVELELTESSLLADANQAKRVLTELRDLGVTLAIDDFGTGYASIPYLTDLPVDVVKIDQSFVFHLHDDPQCAAVTRFSIDLAHGLGLHTVAEGVEDAATQATLTALGCDVMQGYHLARPMPEADLLTWFERADVRVARVGLTEEAR